MPRPPLRLRASAASLAAGFDRIRAELGVPEAFAAAVAAEAEAAAARAPGTTGRADRRDVELASIDPPGARDLDQALAIAPHRGGHRVHYAIADVAAFVVPGGSVDAAARERGVTVYLPDRRTPLYPPVLGEGAASLLPGVDRPALLWTIDLDGAGEPTAVAVGRALVRSRRALSYSEAQAEIEAGGALAPLREVGLRRMARESERGGVSLTVPTQEVVRDGHGYDLHLETPLPVEDWNAQISLFTGMCAARIMGEGGLGLFRVLAAAEEEDLASLRRSAATLGVEWRAGAAYGEVVRALDPARPGHAAFAARAARLFRGAGNAAWRRDDGPPPVHAAIAAPYAHVTAPLRRLADRVANEVVLALSAGVEPPEWAATALDDMPEVMAACGRRERAAERAAIDLVESMVLAPRVGEVFPATVVDVREGRATVQIAEPAVVARLDGAVAPGARVSARLVTADPERRAVRFALASAPAAPLS